MTKGRKKNITKRKRVNKKFWNPKTTEELIVKYVAENFTLSQLSKIYMFYD